MTVRSLIEYAVCHHNHSSAGPATHELVGVCSSDCMNGESEGARVFLLQVPHTADSDVKGDVMEATFAYLSHPMTCTTTCHVCLD